ncbi:MAG: hypothetical protein NTV30_05925 [Chloroflexi bacterium]|nr:hypothetical protein [Chloroflexota bacterium]
MTNNLVLALDPDLAGNEATLRGMEVCRQTLTRKKRQKSTMLGGSSAVQAELRIVSLPEGKDPDEIVKEGIEEWNKFINAALPSIEYLFQSITKNLDMTKTRDKSVVTQRLLPIITELEDDVQRELYLRKLSNIVGVDEKTLGSMAAKMHQTGNEKRKKIAPAAKYTGDQLEERCLCLLLRHPCLKGKSIGIPEDYFNQIENRQIFKKWLENSDSVELQIDASLHEHLDILMLKPLPPVSDEMSEQELDACIRRLREKRLKVLQEEISSMFDDGFIGHDEAKIRIMKTDDELKKVFAQVIRKSSGEEQ